MKKLLVLYVFHMYNDRVKYFINNCIFYNSDIDFVVISNGVKKINVPNYVKLIYRENIGYDFGGWSDALLKNDLYKGYENFIFVNSSVIGPFLPKNNRNMWVYYYLNGLKNNIKLFGSSINNHFNPIQNAHVQSYIFAMDKKTLELLIKKEIFSITNYAKTFDEAINKEILMSRIIIENGWNIGSLMKLYNGVDFTFKKRKPKDYRINFYNDVLYSEYRGKLWTPFQLIFIKGNRPELDHINPDNIFNDIRKKILRKIRILQRRRFNLRRFY